MDRIARVRDKLKKIIKKCAGDFVGARLIFINPTHPENATEVLHFNPPQTHHRQNMSAMSVMSVMSVIELVTGDIIRQEALARGR